MTHGNFTPQAIDARWQENGSTDRIDEWQLSYTTSMDANGGLQSFAGVTIHLVFSDVQGIHVPSLI